VYLAVILLCLPFHLNHTQLIRQEIPTWQPSNLLTGEEELNHGKNVSRNTTKTESEFKHKALRRLTNLFPHTCTIEFVFP
jgi:hypothetical protein